MSENTSTIIPEILEYGVRALGPRSVAVLSDPVVQALVLSRIRAGAELPDAVLAEIHSRAGLDRELANEFLGYFVLDSHRSGRRLISPFLQRFVDTGDLVQSIFGDLCDDFSRLQFETRAQFISLLAMRLRWKAQDHARRLGSNRRGEDHRAEADPGDLALPDTQPSPASAAIAEEERERLALAILRLPERDRLLVRLHLQGTPLSEIMQQTGLSHEAARKAVQRAVIRAREAVT
jgi:RNA polymerase sigma factor (sigma-70 family)